MVGAIERFFEVEKERRKYLTRRTIRFTLLGAQDALDERRVLHHRDAWKTLAYPPSMKFVRRPQSRFDPAISAILNILTVFTFSLFSAAFSDAATFTFRSSEIYEREISSITRE